MDFQGSSNRIRSRLRISLRDLLLILLPSLLWPLLIHLRPHTIDTVCKQDPNACVSQNVFEWDRYSLGRDSWRADWVSYQTQNAAGLFAAATPALLHFSRAIIGSLSPAMTAQLVLTDAIAFTQTLAWNGLITESVRQIAQRPRPYVYQSPADLGANSANYTSFYSGHTSFVAAISVYWILTLLVRDAPFWLLIGSILTSQGLVVITALGRVLSGRHFLTDVLAGAFAGALVGLGIAWLHRKRGRTAPDTLTY